MEQRADRYYYKREGLRYVIRVGTGTHPIFRVWRERTALRICTELLCAFLDGDFNRRDKALHFEEGVRQMNRDLCAKDGHVLGVLARPCLRCHEWFDPKYGLPRRDVSADGGRNVG
jgi:hypothetical protein